MESCPVVIFCPDRQKKMDGGLVNQNLKFFMETVNVASSRLKMRRTILLATGLQLCLFKQCQRTAHLPNPDVNLAGFGWLPSPTTHRYSVRIFVAYFGWLHTSVLWRRDRKQTGSQRLKGWARPLGIPLAFQAKASQIYRLKCTFKHSIKVDCSLRRQSGRCLLTSTHSVIMCVKVDT